MDWKDIVKNVAPIIGGTIGGPFGAAGMKFLAGKLLGDESASEQDLADAVLGASPEQLMLIKKADQEFQVKMRELGFKEEELHIRDRDSARGLAAAQGIMPQMTLSLVYTVGYIAVLWIFIAGDVTIAENIKSEFNMVLGVLTAAQIQIMNFWFGSSSGSKQKTDQLGKK
jgi:hypothetical protein